jgi:transcription initiation factor IIE alpha subunit
MSFSNFYIDIACPKCKYPISVNFQEVKFESVIICHNCKSQMKLKDSNASSHQGEKALTDLHSQLNNLFKK